MGSTVKSGFVADGQQRARQALRARQIEEYPLRSREIQAAVQDRYQNVLARANPLKRWILRLRMDQEINRQLRALEQAHKQELERLAPDSALYFARHR